MSRGLIYYVILSPGNLEDATGKLVIAGFQIIGILKLVRGWPKKEHFGWELKILSVRPQVAIEHELDLLTKGGVISRYDQSRRQLGHLKYRK